MKYQILSRTSKVMLAKIVNEYLADGWLLQGGVSVCFTSSDYEYAQAIVKEEE